MADSTLQTFRERLGEVIDINASIALLHWDQEVNMPPKAAPARGRQLATLSAMAHRMFTDPEMGRMLDSLRDDTTLNDDEEKLVSETLYDYERAAKLPESFVEEFAEEQSKAYQVWVEARKKSDFSIFVRPLEKLVSMLQQKADLMGYEGSPYNALLEDYERGMTVERLQEIFGELSQRQSALVDRIATSPRHPDTGWTEQTWDPQAQWDFSLEVLRDMGYDFDAGRQDKSVHPFTTNFDLYDVRITTRVAEAELFSCLTGSIHEGGHALFEQGFLESDRRTTLAQAPSLGIHESQSRLWENMIGRSLAFWKHYAPRLHELYGGQLDGIDPERIYRAINLVRPSLIRVEADECTYNLHVVLRFEIETALIEGRASVKEIPELWNAKMKEYLGLDVPDDSQGCLQDIHWSHGSMGYFPTYALGNLYAAQLFEKIETDLPDLWNQIEAGDFTPLLGWLRKHVHRFGRRKTASEIVRDATGKEPDSKAFLKYLETKYSALYDLS